MTTKLINEELNIKLKRERVKVCFSCKRFLNCENVGKFEECGDFVEVDD
jgi:hypothetical protein